MDRTAFHQLFNSPGPVVLPVIHVLETARTLANIRVLIAEGAAGCFLINHDFGVEEFLPTVREVRAAQPDLWMGLNFLAVTGREAFPTLGGLAREGCRVDAYWADDARINEHGAEQSEAEEIAQVRQSSGWDGLYFGGTAFKKQRPVAPSDMRAAAANAIGFMDVVTTSGIATGQEADDTKIKDFRAGVGDCALALASGITPGNAERYRNVDAFLVATGINHDGNFYDIEPARLAALMRVARRVGEEGSDG